jgi:hypothetical protein
MFVDNCSDEKDIDSSIVAAKMNKRIMMFVMNALDDGWSVKKEDDRYIFKKKHENKKEVFMESYLEKFILKNMKI